MHLISSFRLIFWYHPAYHQTLADSVQYMQLLCLRYLQSIFLFCWGMNPKISEYISISSSNNSQSLTTENGSFGLNGSIGKFHDSVIVATALLSAVSIFYLIRFSSSANSLIFVSRLIQGSIYLLICVLLYLVSLTAYSFLFSFFRFLFSFFITR